MVLITGEIKSVDGRKYVRAKGGIYTAYMIFEYKTYELAIFLNDGNNIGHIYEQGTGDTSLLMSKKYVDMYVEHLCGCETAIKIKGIKDEVNEIFASSS